MTTTNTPRTILVTGTSSGFGKLTAQTLARAGNRVYASMRGIEGKNQSYADELTSWGLAEGVSLEVIELDVTDAASIDTAVTHILETTGQIDVVVNNAGTGNVGILEGYTIDQVRDIFETNAFGALQVDKAVLPSMRAQGSGLLVHVSSSTGRVVVPFVAPYSAAKMALEGFAEELSFELAAFGVESIIVEPGGYPTDAFAKLVGPGDGAVVEAYGEFGKQPEQMFAAMGEQMSQPGGPNPQEIADAIAQLVELPSGERPLRTVVGDMVTAGVEALNEQYVKSKQELLTSLGAA
jgi:NAD(P)-dependent dehydrogenase (short-subunit alcohol dehydrogenase family)